MEYRPYAISGKTSVMRYLFLHNADLSHSALRFPNCPAPSQQHISKLQFAVCCYKCTIVQSFHEGYFANTEKQQKHSHIHFKGALSDLFNSYLSAIY